jgi:hypothetical protein
MKVKKNGSNPHVTLTPMEVGRLCQAFVNSDVIDNKRTCEKNPPVNPEWVALGLVTREPKFSKSDLAAKVKEVIEANKAVLQEIISEAKSRISEPLKVRTGKHSRDFYELDNKLKAVPEPEDIQAEVYKITDKGRRLIQEYMNSEVSPGA